MRKNERQSERRFPRLRVVAGMAGAVLAVVIAATGCGKNDRSQPAAEPSQAASPEAASAEAASPEVVVSKSGAEMVMIRGGWFTMGSDHGERDEGPPRRVWVDSFLMDRREVTQEQYSKLVIGNPSRFKAPRAPVEQVRWSEAILYCNARSLAEGLEPCYDEETEKCNFQVNGYRLPTEAEWEYACRAGAEGDRFFQGGDRVLSEYAWYAENANKKPHPVGQKRANPWGLFDVYGNVAEWCNDYYAAYNPGSPEKNPTGPGSGKERVIRGGAWNSRADGCRSTCRAGVAPGSFQDACFARPDIGFRCVRRPGERERSPTEPQKK